MKGPTVCQLLLLLLAFLMVFGTYIKIRHQNDSEITITEPLQNPPIYEDGTYPQWPHDEGIIIDKNKVHSF